MKPEFSIEQIRQFVDKGYTSVSARYVKAMLQYYDEVVKNNAVLPHVSGSFACTCLDCGTKHNGYCPTCKPSK